MLYDNGPLPSGDRPRSPMYQNPSYTPTPRTPFQQSDYTPGIQHSPGQRPLYALNPNRLPSMQRSSTPMQQPMQQQPFYGQRPMYGFAGGGSMMGQGGRTMGYRRRPMYQRDASGNMPGEWDYQQPPQYAQQPMQLY